MMQHTPRKCRRIREKVMDHGCQLTRTRQGKRKQIPRWITHPGKNSGDGSRSSRICASDPGLVLAPGPEMKKGNPGGSGGGSPMVPRTGPRLAKRSPSASATKRKRSQAQAQLLYRQAQAQPSASARQAQAQPSAGLSQAQPSAAGVKRKRKASASAAKRRPPPSAGKRSGPQAQAQASASARKRSRRQAQAQPKSKCTPASPGAAPARGGARKIDGP